MRHDMYDGTCYVWLFNETFIPPKGFRHSLSIHLATSIKIFLSNSWGVMVSAIDRINIARRGGVPGRVFRVRLAPRILIFTRKSNLNLHSPPSESDGGECKFKFEVRVKIKFPCAGRTRKTRPGTPPRNFTAWKAIPFPEGRT